ncbi:AzlC family ABC transporter permease [Fodinisporobacter ferrooxydans]|uniref:AzlC family ABC transporter permease n=1 Tax=Fodinisporobacter ferrooxydans TaxID=2901836 RepID=A0ABY4CGM2_9BACL|nr:AzlC family ABC transporter permease [Alicyclobacillaceae bacterium MYW30-H2]
MLSYTSTSIAQNTSPLRKEFIRAAVDTVPLSLNVFAYGLAFGALANNATHLTLVQTIAMSFFVFAGPAQFSVLTLLKQDASFLTMFISTLLINARYIIYGLSLGRAMRETPKRHFAWLSHGLTDESYSMAMVNVKNGLVDAGYFAGAASPIFFSWLASGALGFELGGLIHDPKQFGLDFVFIGAFIGLLVAQLQHHRHVFAGLAAAVTSVLAYHWFGTTGAVFAGALVAFLVGVCSE